MSHIQVVGREIILSAIHTDDVSRVNKRGEFVYIKYHFIADRGQKQSTADEAIQMCGEDPDFSKRDLYQAIEKGEKISWTAHVQIMKPEEADPTKLGFDPFDVTKV
jgi:catalase